MPCQQVIYMRRTSKKIKVTLTESARGIYIRPQSNNTSSSPPSGAVKEKRALPEEKYYGELTAGSGDENYFFQLVTDRYLQIGDINVGNGSMNSHIHSQQDFNFNNVDGSC